MTTETETPTTMTTKAKATPETTRDQLHALYWDEDLSLSEIGARIGLSTTAVFNRMRKYGIDMRPRDHGIRGTENYMHPDKVAARGGGPEANPMYGRQHTEEARQKMRDAWALRKAQKRGEAE